MSDEVKLPETMTVIEALRLKHQLGQDITWGSSGLNALQIQELTKLTREDFARIRNGYKDNRSVTLFPTYVLLLMMVGCAAAYYFVHYGWARGAALLIGMMCFMNLMKREGHAEGYVEGYEIGHDEGIHKVLGIKPEELDEMHKFANDMTIDEMVLKKMDEPKK
jgi:hypothetical protein